MLWCTLWIGYCVYKQMFLIHFCGFTKRKCLYMQSGGEYGSIFSLDKYSIGFYDSRSLGTINGRSANSSLLLLSGPREHCIPNSNDTTVVRFSTLKGHLLPLHQYTSGCLPAAKAATEACGSVYWDLHDDVIKWKHFPRNWPFVRGIHRPPVNSPHKGQWRKALIFFSLICVWINYWVKNREAGDFRRYRAHYDVIIMGKQTRR